MTTANMNCLIVIALNSAVDGGTYHRAIEKETYTFAANTWYTISGLAPALQDGGYMYMTTYCYEPYVGEKIYYDNWSVKQVVE